MHRLHYKILVAARYNPLGAVLDTALSYRLRLYESRSPALAQNHLALVLRPVLSPAFALLGAGVEVQPLTVLTVRAMVNTMGYFATFDRLQSFDSPAAPHDDDTLRDRGEAGLNYAATGVSYTLKTTLRLKVGPVVLLDELELFYWDMNLRRGDRVFYNSLLDTVVPGRGPGLANHAHLFYLFDGVGAGLLAGVRYTVMHVRYPGGEGGALANPNTPIHMIGPMLLYRFFDRPGARFGQPSLALILNWYITHRYRTGANVSRAVPYAVLAFITTGDLL